MDYFVLQIYWRWVENIYIYIYIYIYISNFMDFNPRKTKMK